MPKKYPPEFKRDVLTVARRSDLSVVEVAIDFGVAEDDGARGKSPGLLIEFPHLERRSL